MKNYYMKKHIYQKFHYWRNTKGMEIKKMFIDKGRKEGVKKEKNNIIEEMLKKNMTIDLIAEVTHSSRNSILKIAKS